MYQIIHEYMDGMIFSAYVGPLDYKIREKVQRKKPKVLIIIILFAAAHDHSSEDSYTAPTLPVS